MAKRQTFADKARKQSMIKGSLCPVCNEVMQPIKLITPEVTPVESVRFRQKLVRICKCNRDKVLA